MTQNQPCLEKKKKSIHFSTFYVVLKLHLLKNEPIICHENVVSHAARAVGASLFNMQVSVNHDNAVFTLSHVFNFR